MFLVRLSLYLPPRRIRYLRRSRPPVPWQNRLPIQSQVHPGRTSPRLSGGPPSPEASPELARDFPAPASPALSSGREGLRPSLIKSVAGSGGAAGAPADEPKLVVRVFRFGPVHSLPIPSKLPTVSLPPAPPGVSS